MKLIKRLKKSLGNEVRDFKLILTSKSTLKKQKKYRFDFTENDILQGKKATFDNPYFCKREKGSVWFALYVYEGKFIAQMFHSFDKFERL